MGQKISGHSEARTRLEADAEGADAPLLIRLHRTLVKGLLLRREHHHLRLLRDLRRVDWHRQRPGCIAAEAGSISAAARGLRRDAARRMGDAPNNKAELYSEVFFISGAVTGTLATPHALSALPRNLALLLHNPTHLGTTLAARPSTSFMLPSRALSTPGFAFIDLAILRISSAVFVPCSRPNI